MKILKKLFGGNTKIHVDEIADSTGRLLGESVIVDSGSNTNGHWIKYADGTMICYHSISTGKPVNIAKGSIFVSEMTTWTYPQAFIDRPKGNSISVVGGLAFSWGVLGDNGANSLVMTFRVASPVSELNHAVVNIFAIGRWK